MKHLVNLVCLFLPSLTFAQEFYELSTVQTIEITFEESNWDHLLDAACAIDAGYILAQSVTINGETFDSVGVKYKGNSSYNAHLGYRKQAVKWTSIQ